MNLKADPLAQMETYLGGFLKGEAPPSKPGPGLVPSVTVSRQAGSRGDRIVPLLAEFLRVHETSPRQGWAYFDQELVARVLEDHELPPSIGEYMPEDVKSPLVGAIEEMLQLHPSEWTLFQDTAITIRKLCRMGGAIIVGRGGNFVAADLPNTFHVRLIGSVSRRQEYLQDRDGLPPAKALRRLRETDRARERYVRQHLQVDVADPTHHHLVVNTDDLDDGVAAELIGLAVTRWTAHLRQHPRRRIRVSQTKPT